MSVQLARKPEPTEAKEGAASGGEGASGNEGRKRTGGRGRGRGRARGRGGRVARGRVRKLSFFSPSLTRFRTSSLTRWGLQAQEGQEPTEANTTEATPLAETTNDNEPATAEGAKQGKPRAARPQKQRGPPEDGIPSKTKVMVANLPYDLTEDKVCACLEKQLASEQLLLQSHLAPY